MRLIITGYAQHGKDTVCDFLQSIYGLKSISSSLFALQHTDAFDSLSKELNLDKKMLYINRGKYRKEFFDTIAEYNHVNGMSALGRGIFEQFSVYNGIRNDAEFYALKEENIFDYAIWVDASKRKPPEDVTSCKMKPQDCHYILDNNGNKPRLVRALLAMMDGLWSHTGQSQFSSKF